ncbi:MAG: hypothetical protein KAR45_04440, partial [Desulfobacteraceae bacterium]|nr:hypothetical protein [Desulfobacteraceae bacterium]
LFKIAPKKRIVCAGKWGEERIVMKFFLESRKADFYFNKELMGLKALKRSGTRTPDIVFFGIVENSNIKMIALKEIVPASDMMSVWNNTKEDSGYAVLQKRILRKIAVLHNAGLKQTDLHLGNFLISINRIYTIDGDSVDVTRKGNPLSKELSLENLSILFGQFYPRLDKIAEQSLEYYAECRGWTSDPDYSPGLFTRLKPKIQKVRAIKQKKYLKKIFRECSEFVHKKTRGMELVCDRKAYNSGLEKFINNPDLFINNGKTLIDNNTSSIAQIDIDNTLYVVKTFNIKSFSLFMQKLLKKTHTRTLWRNAHLLKQLGDQLPYPLLFMEKHSGPFCLKAYFIVKHISEYESDNYSKLFKKLESNQLNPGRGGL